MRILVVQETDWIERGPHQQHHLFERLETRGHEVNVIDFEFIWSEQGSRERYRAREVKVPDPHTTEGAQIELIRPPMIKFPVVDYASIVPAHYWEIRRQLTKFDPDIVVGFGILNTYLAARLSKTYDVPFIYYLIDHLHTLLKNKTLQTIAKQLEVQTIRQSHYVYTINEGLREYAINLGAGSHKTRVIPGGVDVEKYRDGDPEAVDLPTDIKEDETVLFFMGWLYEFSGLRELATDLANAVEYDNIRLLIAGEGDLYDELSEIKQNQLGEKMILTGQVPFKEIPHYLAHADICLLPAEHNETMHDIVPIKMYEYLASGSPVVATRLPGLEKEFGEDNGVIYTNGPNDAFETIVDLMESDEYSRHAREGLKFAERHDWTHLTDRFEEHLSGIVEGKSPPSRD